MTAKYKFSHPLIDMRTGEQLTAVVEIDMNELALKLANKAIRTKTGRTTMAEGAIKARVCFPATPMKVAK